MLALVLALFADTTTPAATVRWRACAAAIEQARDLLGESYSIVRDADVIVGDRGVRIWFEDGWCMHHTSGEISVEDTRSSARAWRRRAGEHGYTAERRAHGRRATITYYDHNESESSGGVDGLDEALLRAFQPAIDSCLDRVGDTLSR